MVNKIVLELDSLSHHCRNLSNRTSKLINGRIQMWQYTLYNVLVYTKYPTYYTVYNLYWTIYVMQYKICTVYTKESVQYTLDRPTSRNLPVPTSIQEQWSCLNCGLLPHHPPPTLCRTPLHSTLYCTKIHYTKHYTVLPTLNFKTLYYTRLYYISYYTVPHHTLHCTKLHTPL